MLRIKLFGQAFMEMIAVVGSAMLLLVGGTQGKLGYLTTMDAWGRSMGVSPLGGFGELMLMAFVLTVLWLPVRMLFSGKGEGEPERSVHLPVGEPVVVQAVVLTHGSLMADVWIVLPVGTVLLLPGSDDQHGEHAP